MKRFVLLSLMAVALCGAAEDRFYMEDCTIGAGETCTMEMLLDNEAVYTAFQADVYLPDGLTATNYALTGRKNANHTLSVSTLPDGGHRLLSYSLNLKTYSGNSGALVTLDVTASDDFSGPAIIALRNVIFTTEGGTEIAFADEDCSVTSNHLAGDVNNDGKLSISDVSALIDYLLGNEAGVNVANADVNGDGHITIADVSVLIDRLLAQ